MKTMWQRLLIRLGLRREASTEDTMQILQRAREDMNAITGIPDHLRGVRNP